MCSKCSVPNAGVCDEPEVCKFCTDTKDCGPCPENGVEASLVLGSSVPENLHAFRLQFNVDLAAVLMVGPSQITISEIIDPNAPACTPPGNTQRNFGSINHGPYAASEVCSWMLKCQGDGLRPRLHFASFATESGYDYLTVYDGDGDDWPQLMRESGYSTPPDQVGTGSSLFLKFTSDGSAEADGFRATFSCGTGAGRRMMDLRPAALPTEVNRRSLQGGGGGGGGGGPSTIVDIQVTGVQFTGLERQLRNAEYIGTYPLRSFSVVEVVIVECAPGCIASWVNDGFCDDECNHPRCGFDGTDCGGPPDCAEGCPVAWRADGYCDDTCNNGFCNFDDGDCGGNGGGDGAVALCQYENDDTCDVPNYCPAGTDHDDCGGCEDVPGWDDPVDSSSTGCEGWVGYDCNEAFDGWSAPSVVLQACPETCGLCGVLCLCGQLHSLTVKLTLTGFFQNDLITNCH